MRAIDPERTHDNHHEAVGLGWRFDDPEDPAEVTVFDPDAPDPTTAWITAGADHAVPLDGTR